MSPETQAGRFSRLKAQVGWVMYDFANTIFSMNIVTYYFSPWIIHDLGVEDIFFSIAYSGSMLAVAVTMLSLGRWADRSGSKMKGLKIFTLSSVLCTVLMSAVGFSGLSITLTVVVALFLFAAANYFYEGSMPFYNSLLADVSTPENVGKVSGYGVALGYAGAILGLLMVQPFTRLDLFEGVSERVYAFLPTALLFLLFAVPTFLWVREQRRAPVTAAPEPFFGRLRATVREIRLYPGALRYFIGDFLIKDAVNTIVVFMAVYAEAVVGFRDQEKLQLFVIATAVAVPGSALFGLLADKFRAKPALLAAVVGWIGVLTAGVLFTGKTQFYILGALLGTFLGAVWTTTRPLLNTLVPVEKHGQFYGIYSFCGKAAAVIGPLLWGLVVLIGREGMPLGDAALSVANWLGMNTDAAFSATIHYRLALASQILALVGGLIAIAGVPNRRRYRADVD